MPLRMHEIVGWKDVRSPTWPRERCPGSNRTEVISTFRTFCSSLSSTMSGATFGQVAVTLVSSIITCRSAPLAKSRLKH